MGVLEFDPRLRTNKRKRGRRASAEPKTLEQILAETVEEICAASVAQEPDADAQADHLIALLQFSLQVISVSRRRSADVARFDAAVEMVQNEVQS